MMQDWFNTDFSRLPLLQLDDDFEQKILSPLSCLKEHQSKWTLEFDLPLVDKKDVSVSIDSDEMITVEAKLRETYTESKTSQEYEYQYFKKSISLPKNIDVKKIIAQFTDGRLIIILPKLFQGTKIKIK